MLTQPLFVRPDYVKEGQYCDKGRLNGLLTSCGGLSPASFTRSRYWDKMIRLWSSSARELVDPVTTSTNPFFDQNSSQTCSDSLSMLSVVGKDLIWPDAYPMESEKVLLEPVGNTA